MKHFLTLILACCLLLPALFGCAESQDEPTETAPIPESGGITLFVSPDGNDSAAGTMDAPLASLAGAKEKVRTLLPTAESPITVYFRGGEYGITEDAAFTAEDSGTAEHPVTYTAYPGENVSFSGGVRVPADKVSKVTDDGILSRILDDTAREALMQADLSGITDVLPEIFTYEHKENDAYHAVNIYIGENRLSPARWPNAESLFGPANYVTSPNLIREEDSPDGQMNSFVLYDDEAAERIALWSDEAFEHLYLRGFFVGDWLMERFDAHEVHREEKGIRVHVGSSNDTYYRPNEEHRIFFQNILEEIDVPGESFTDTDKRVVYFYPTENAADDPVIVGLYGGIPITLDGAAHIRFEGITFEYLRNLAVFGESADDIVIKNCTFTHGGSSAIQITDSTMIDIDGCVFTDLTSGAIILTGGDRTTLTHADNVIENCEFCGVNRDGVWWDQAFYDRTGLWSRNAAMTVFGCGFTISHNVIHESPFTILSIGGMNDLVIEYNEVYDCLWETSDNGTMGYGRDASILGVVLRYNYFHGITNGVEGVGQFCFYADDGSIAPQVYGNLFVLKDRVEKAHDDGYQLSPLLFNGSQYGVVRNNVVVGYDWGVRFNSWSENTGSVQGLWAFRLYEWAGNFTGIGAPNETWFEHYKDTSWAKIFDIFTLERLEKYRTIETEKLKKNFAYSFAPYNTNDVYGNVFVGLDTPPVERGMNTHDNYETADTGVFADYEHDDFTLTADALAAIRAVIPEFEELPLDQIGPQK